MAKKVVGYIELHWRCPNCGTQNQGSEKSCSSCGSPQPPDVEFYQLADAALLEDEEKIKAAKVGPDVHCPYCGTRNTANAENCVRCGGDLKDAHQRVAGKVLGEFGAQSQPASSETECPACHQPNNNQARYCVQCGSPLKVNAAVAQPAIPDKMPASQPAPAALTGKKKLSPVLLIIAGVVIFGCIAALILSLLLRGGNDAVIATVSEAYWKTSINIEEQVYVERESWRDMVPSNARDLYCQEELYGTSSVASAGAVEVCSEPYTVDLGNGNAEVVQDCEYQIYKDYCSFEVLDWAVVDTIVYDGYDNDPDWTEPSLSTGQVLGSVTETYVVTFYGEGRSFTYQPQNRYEFQQLQEGTAWKLEMGAFGGIRSISPVK